MLAKIRKDSFRKMGKVYKKQGYALIYVTYLFMKIESEG